MLHIQLPQGLEVAKRGDWKQLADVTAQSFAEDPVNRWVFGETRAIQSCFRVLAREIYTKRGICHFARGADGAVVGATMWVCSDEVTKLSKLGEMSLALGVARHGSKGALERAQRAGEIMTAHHPKPLHMYLFTIGVLPSARGTGLGRRLVTPMLEACDRSGMACYLENSNPDNFSFYAAHGFEHMKYFAAGEGGPPLQAMWREARAPS